MKFLSVSRRGHFFTIRKSFTINLFCKGKKTRISTHWILSAQYLEWWTFCKTESNTSNPFSFQFFGCILYSLITVLTKASEYWLDETWNLMILHTKKWIRDICMCGLIFTMTTSPESVLGIIWYKSRSENWIGTEQTLRENLHFSQFSY